MTSLLNIAGNIPVSAAAAVAGQSLRFEDGDSPYLTRTPTTAGNQQTWTWSGWVKRGNLGNNYFTLFSAKDASLGNYFWIQYTSTNDDQLNIYNYPASDSFQLTTTGVFRDPSAWYHVVVVSDTTNATSGDRIKLYINGERVTSFSTENYPAQNYNTAVNRTNKHSVGSYDNNSYFYDGYLANVCFIDGQALDPTSFGEYQDTLWKPKSDADITSLTFGTNGFYLPFKQTTEAEGFSTVTYTGNGGTQSIEGVGFEPDFVWFKKRASGTNRDHILFDTVRGVGNRLRASGTAAESSASDELQSFDSTGFTVGSSDNENGSGNPYVAWCWDAGTGSAVSNANGSITSTVKANTTNGFSIISFVGDATAGSTVGHGLSSTPEMVISKNRDDTTSWLVYHKDLDASNPEQKRIFLNLTDAVSDSTTPWNDTAPTSSLLTLGTSGYTNGSGDDMIMYAFHSVSGYSSIGSYTGTGAAGNSITGLGFEPAWIIVKRTDNTSNWSIYDNTRTPVNPRNLTLYTNLSNAETTSTSNAIDFDNDGFTLLGTGTTANASGGTYIYLAFADTRDATFFGDTSGNGNNWTPNALNNTDVVLDSPVTGDNFATLNSIGNMTSTTYSKYSEGNLRFDSSASGSSYGRTVATQAISSGKFYWEIYIGGQVSTYLHVNGLADETAYYITVGTSARTQSGFHVIEEDGQFYSNGTLQATYSTLAIGDILQVWYDADNGDLYMGKNGTAFNSGSAILTGLSGTKKIICQVGASSAFDIYNFGQDSSFAGNKTPQGNTDDNGVGDFYYAPPSGFLALTTGNLPTPTITAPDEYFNTVLYSGDGTSSNAITGVNFQPDWTWIKGRNNARNHVVFDSVRNNGGSDDYLALITNSTGAEQQQADGDGLLSLDSDGFTVGYNNNVTFNNSGDTYASWNWLAGGTAVSNTDGSITSTVSANTDAGISIIEYTGTGSQPETVGHGLGATPNFIIVKDRDAATNWHVFHSAVMPYTTDGKFLRLNTTDALLTDGSANVWYAGDFTSTVFGVGLANGVSSRDYIAYCFAEVEGYSKFSSFEGNSDTTNFVHCGFRPAWVMIKCVDSARDWIVFDNKRNTYNVATQYLYPNQNYAEGSSSTIVVDFLSNGFNIKGGNNVINAYGQTLIFAAFAEAPFKNANAR